jgi:hypothetical protein
MADDVVVYRDKETKELVTEEYAKANPDTTVAEVMKFLSE